jgi:hypothetical protein
VQDSIAFRTIVVSIARNQSETYIVTEEGEWWFTETGDAGWIMQFTASEGEQREPDADGLYSLCYTDQRFEMTRDEVIQQLMEVLAI